MQCLPLRLKNVIYNLGWEGPKKLRLGTQTPQGYCRTSEVGYRADMA
jgi:hypothetical protein